MVLIQLDLNKEEDKVVKQYMLDHDIIDKRDAIKKIIQKVKK